MLFGTERFFHLLRPGRYTGDRRVPALEETELGWILAGHIQHPGQPFVGAGTSCLALHSYSVSGRLKSFILFPKLHSSWNVRVVSLHPLQQMTLGDLSCRYHGIQVTRH